MTIDGLREAAVKRAAPDGSYYAALTLDGAQQLALARGVALRIVEAEALRVGIVPERYQRTVLSVGISGQLALTEAHVGIAGAGGLGGTLAEILARSGVGTITIVDCDTFEESNLNRQLMCDIGNIGAPKVRATRERIARINPATEVRDIVERIDDDNAAVFFGGTSLIADALGSIKPRFAVEHAARTRGVPLVHAAVAGNRGQLATVYPHDAGLDAIYGTAAAAPKTGREIFEGTPPAAVWTVAALAAHEIVRIVAGSGALHRNRLAVIDLDACSYRSFALGSATTR